MIIIDYDKEHHKQIIDVSVLALKQGKTVAYPTDTCYGLAVDASSPAAINKLYLIKGRNFNKPVSVVVPSLTFAKKIVKWNAVASKIAKRFWPGALTLVLGLRVKGEGFSQLTAKSGWIGLRMPKNKVALDLAKFLKKPITATSANLSGKKDCYSAGDIARQFQNQKYQPDIIINAGKLPKRRPSTMVKIFGGKVEVLRSGSVSEKQLRKVLDIRS